VTLTRGDPRHGTPNGYGWHRCRCEACTEAHTVYLRENELGPYRKDPCPSCGQPKGVHARLCIDCYRELNIPDHGTESRYRWCACDECREAAAAARQRRRLRAAEALADP
jgi:hypothetical protein